tara:strand:+ start:3318 stop:3632 length:315 start_codon:yes stop_codon:yes gene_type:complete
MGDYRVYTTEPFDEEVEKLEKSEKERLEKLYPKLAENPFVGDQLQYKHLREKRLREKRVYYLVYENLKTVLMVAISGKKDQQATINYIVGNFDKFRDYLRDLLG